ncbi:MAG TPA: diacylglycerol kinase family protein [Candidatus Limnocylindria bacterium]|nr:diacylglycerol kinase family protein [Candidatus Limnocylindria bacterium]
MELLRSFSYALAGLRTLLGTERNFRLEVAVAALAVIAGVWLGLERLEWAVLGLTIALVLILEAVNTAVEDAVTLASPELDPTARAAKDVSAAAVLVAAILSVVVGVLLFGSRLFRIG